MNRKIPKSIFLFSVVICTILRVYLKLSVVDPSTGFYEGGEIVPLLFNVILLVSCAALLISGFLTRSADTHTVSDSKVMRSLSILTGVCTLVFSATKFFDMLGTLYFSDMADIILSIASIFFFVILPVISGFLFVFSGFKGLHSVSGILWLVPLFWQVAVLLTSFMSYTAIRFVSDQMLIIVMLIFLVPFLLGHGRTLADINSARGIRYLTAFGLPFSVLAISASAGTIVANLTGRTLSIVMPLPAALFYLCLGIYAAAAVFSIQEVEA